MNVKSINLHVSTDYESFSTEDLRNMGVNPNGLIGLQNNTGGVVRMKMGGGDGVFKIHKGETYIFNRMFQGDFEIKSSNAGKMCLLS